MKLLKTCEKSCAELIIVLHFPKLANNQTKILLIRFILYIEKLSVSNDCK